MPLIQKEKVRGSKKNCSGITLRLFVSKQINEVNDKKGDN